jgi:succinate dehydrogenase/fumarate reductase flavoprotein subunit
MKEFEINENNLKNYHSVIIGSGTAGLNCALHLVTEGIPSDKIAIITDNLGGGTSFNAGSDKQTYYKMSIYGNQADSPHNLAKDLFIGGAMHGDIALIEATNSIREFFHLVQLGVPFPYDEYGGFVGYKTDNDPKQRATSIGPFTSQKMGECLLNEVEKKGITIYDKHLAIKILTNESADIPEAIGVLCINKENLYVDNVIDSLTFFKSRNTIIATGGPALLYGKSVYPESQKGAMSLAIEAGCKLQNLTESQFGLASIKFRWNVSGSYQQVIPRYISVDSKGIQREFLNDVFPSFKELSKAVFLKGYQWPFNATLIESYGSSLIDLAVYHESIVLKRNVFLDYTQNPKDFEYENLHPIAKHYLDNSKAFGEKPFERLKKLNPQAINVYSAQGINIDKEPLEIAVCNQHLNGGISCDKWWESSTIKHLYAIGEANGSHGIHRPGGAALNAGQVGGLRVSQKIAYSKDQDITLDDKHFNSFLKEEVNNIINNIETIFKNTRHDAINPEILLSQIQERMSKYACIIRPLNNLESELEIVQDQLINLENLLKISRNLEIIDYFHIRDVLLTQLLFLKAILNYHQSYGRSRGSFLILRENLDPSISEMLVVPPGYLKEYKFIHNNLDLSKKIQTVQWKNGKILVDWEEVRDIPREFGWFENVWKDFTNRKIYK